MALCNSKIYNLDYSPDDFDEVIYMHTVELHIIDLHMYYSLIEKCQ